MQQKHMGSSGPEGLVPLADAARTLGVNRRTITRWIRSGLIEPLYVDRHVFFRRDDVASLEQVARAKDLDLPSVAQKAQLAYASSRRAERRLEELRELLGLNRPELSFEPASVHEMHAAATRVLADPSPNSSTVVRYWAGVMFGIDEEYLRALRGAGIKCPWRVFLELGDRLAGDAGDRRVRDRHAYDYLDAARDRLRHVTYFHVRALYGENKANELFPEPTNFTDRILSLMYLG